MTVERDSQRSKVYQAENVWQARRRMAGIADERYATLDGVQAFLDRLTGKATFRRRWPAFRMPELRPGYGARRAYGNGNALTLPLWARTSHTVIHELSHCLRHQAQTEQGTSARWDEAGHGWQFCDTELQLVRIWFGADAERALRAEFRQHKVRVRPKRPVTDAQRAAWAKSLQKADAARGREPSDIKAGERSWACQPGKDMVKFG